MKTNFIRLTLMAIISGFLLVGFAGCDSSSNSSKNVTLTTEKEKVGYSIGMNFAKQFIQQNIDISHQALLAGIEDVFNKKELKISEKDAMTTMNAFRKKMMEKFQNERTAKLKKNVDEGHKFLVENKKRKGVTSLPSGLQYEIIKKGKGKKPRASDFVVTNYKGSLIDGTEFDSSYKRGKPAEFPVQGVIKGWQEALKLMPVGSKWKLYIPAKLAYGERGQGRVIGPNSTLIFEMELLEIKKKSKKGQRSLTSPHATGKPNIHLKK